MYATSITVSNISWSGLLDFLVQNFPTIFCTEHSIVQPNKQNFGYVKCSYGNLYQSHSLPLLKLINVRVVEVIFVCFFRTWFFPKATLKNTIYQNIYQKNPDNVQQTTQNSSTENLKSTKIYKKFYNFGMMGGCGWSLIVLCVGVEILKTKRPPTNN